MGSVHRQEILLRPRLAQFVPEVVEVLDEPLADPSILPTLLLSRFVRRHVTVALAGDGGDELFAGYDTFLAHGAAGLAARLPRPALRVVTALATLLPSSPRNMSLDFRVKQFLRGWTGPASLRHQAWIGSFTPPELSALLAPELRRLATPEVAWREVLDEAARATAGRVAPGRSTRRCASSSPATSPTTSW